jgi:hypothetical protein
MLWTVQRISRIMKWQAKYHELLRRINGVKVYGKYMTSVHQFVYNNLYSRYNCLTDVFEIFMKRIERSRQEMNCRAKRTFLSFLHPGRTISYLIRHFPTLNLNFLVFTVYIGFVIFIYCLLMRIITKWLILTQTTHTNPYAIYPDFNLERDFGFFFD